MFKNVHVPTRYCARLFAVGRITTKSEFHGAGRCRGETVLELRGITPDIFDGIVYGATIPQPMCFMMPPILPR